MVEYLTGSPFIDDLVTAPGNSTPTACWPSRTARASESNSIWTPWKSTRESASSRRGPLADPPPHSNSASTRCAVHHLRRTSDHSKTVNRPSCEATSAIASR